MAKSQRTQGGVITALNRSKKMRQASKYVVASVIGSMCLNSAVFASPVGGRVVAGQASITNTANGLRINQTTGKAAIDWNSFDIAANEAVQFIQPDTSSLVLNRVLASGDGTQIYGSLTANGGVMVLDSNGILFGQGSIVDVNS